MRVKVKAGETSRVSFEKLFAKLEAATARSVADGKLGSSPRRASIVGARCGPQIGHLRAPLAYSISFKQPAGDRVLGLGRRAMPRAFAKIDAIAAGTTSSLRTPGFTFGP